MRRKRPRSESCAASPTSATDAATVLTARPDVLNPDLFDPSRLFRDTSVVSALHPTPTTPSSAAIVDQAMNVARGNPLLSTPLTSAFNLKSYELKKLKLSAEPSPKERTLERLGRAAQTVPVRPPIYVEHSEETKIDISAHLDSDVGRHFLSRVILRGGLSGLVVVLRNFRKLTMDEEYGTHGETMPTSAPTAHEASARLDETSGLEIDDLDFEIDDALNSVEFFNGASAIPSDIASPSLQNTPALTAETSQSQTASPIEDVPPQALQAASPTSSHAPAASPSEVVASQEPRPSVPRDVILSSEPMSFTEMLELDLNVSEPSRFEATPPSPDPPMSVPLDPLFESAEYYSSFADAATSSQNTPTASERDDMACSESGGDLVPEDILKLKKNPRTNLYHCPYQDCSVMLTRRYNLKIHYMTHLGPSWKLFQCPECERSFNRKNDVMRHRISKHNVPPPSL
ncbi:hypothetical protein DFJ73DRAFT_867770 [Zopfochytrium polystomum]|nr:hypothetical protein DFJ73DRAFT_867770 [Zopfochytrium polystomum]